jgi:hypothetical protein
MRPKRGCLIRWVSDYETYAAYPDGLVGFDPVYRHGIVMEIASGTDPVSMIVFCYDCSGCKWTLIDLKTEEYEVLSNGK